MDYAKTDLDRVKQLQKTLGTDYLYILWAPSVTTNGQKSLATKDYSMMQVIAQLYEFPGAREVGHGTYMMRVDPDKKEIVRDDLQRVTKELAEGDKRGRESFLDNTPAPSLQNPPCPAVLASLLATSLIMS